MNPISTTREPVYPALDRAAFLIERASVPRYYPPRYGTEAAQLLAMLEAVRQRQPTQSTNEVNKFEH